MMDANLIEAWSKAQPISVELLKDAAATIRDRKEMAAILEKLPAAIEGVFASMNPIRSRITMNWAIQSFARDVKKATAHQYQSQRGALALWIDAERDLDALLCELAFGGTGIDGGEDEAARPVSKLEKRLRQQVFELLADTISSAFGDFIEAPFTRIAPEEDDAADNEPVEVLEVKYLMNVFSYSTEFTCRFPVQQLEYLLRDETIPGSQKDACVFDSLNDCDFQVDVLLPEEAHDLAEVLFLKPGDVLALGIPASAPVQIFCEGESIFEGEIRPGQGRMEVVVKPLEDQDSERQSGEGLL
jgi:flagellar motor switch/type III secretory pathway protein FliN